MKFQLQSSVKTNSQSLFFTVTHWILHFLSLQQRRKPLFMRLNYSSLPPTCEAHPENMGSIVKCEIHFARITADQYLQVFRQRREWY